MTTKKLAMIPLLAFALFAVGCEADCETNCEDSKDCDGASATDEDTDCAEVCEDFEKLAKDASCEEEWDDFLSCASDDVCDTDEACDAESDAYAQCIVKYCTEPSHEEQCEALLPDSDSTGGG